MKRLLVLLMALILGTSAFAFETQTAVENSEFAGYVMEECDITVVHLTTFVARECLIRIVKNMGKPCNVFNWDDDKAEEVSAVVDDFFCLVMLGKYYDELENKDALLYKNTTIFVEDVATLVETFGFDENKALDVAVKTIRDLNEEYGE